jgi:hypothetical protein
MRSNPGKQDITHQVPHLRTSSRCHNPYLRGKRNTGDSKRPAGIGISLSKGL